MNSGGDSLARGMAKFTFRPAGANVSQADWDRIWKDDEAVNAENDGSRPNAETDRDACADVGSDSEMSGKS